MGGVGGGVDGVDCCLPAVLTVSKAKQKLEME